MTVLKKREAVPVEIGPFKMYCESMKFKAETTVYERPTITGAATMTNKCTKMTRVSFTGRIYNESRPMFSAGFANNINGLVNYDIIYRDLKFRSCIITGFSAEDSGENYITLTVHAATSMPVVFLT